MSTAKIDNVIGSFLPIPVIEHATDHEVFTSTAAQTVFTTTKFDRSNAIRVIAKSSGGAFSEVTASWTGANTVTISGAILGAGQIVYIFKVGTHASKIRVQDANGAWVDLSAYSSSLAQKGANNDITSLSGLTTPLSVTQGGSGKTTEFRKGYIDGLRMVYTNRTTLTVQAGCAYIPSLGYIVELSADKVLTPTLAASTWYHMYLYDNAGTIDIEFTLTGPTRYYDTAYNKTGDTSRRYIGSALTNSSSQFMGFKHNTINSEITWVEGTPLVAPFQLTNNWTGTSPSAQPTGTVCPIATATHLHAGVQSIGLAYFYSFEQQVVGNSSQFMQTIGIIGGTVATLHSAYIDLCRVVGVNLGGYLVSAQPSISGAYVSTFAYGYRFER